MEAPIKIQLRQSQIKFEAQDLSFNVIRASTFGQGYFNRQVIMLLYCLGVPETYFTDLQKSAIAEIQVKVLAQKLQSGKLSQQLQQARMFNNVFKWFTHSKLDVQTEPLISQLLYGIQLCSYQAIKKKARILVPNSATLIGTVDSDGILEENEIFVQIRRDSFKCSDAKDD